MLNENVYEPNMPECRDLNIKWILLVLLSVFQQTHKEWKLKKNLKEKKKIKQNKTKLETVLTFFIKDITFVGNIFIIFVFVSFYFSIVYKMKWICFHWFGCCCWCLQPRPAFATVLFSLRFFFPLSLEMLSFRNVDVFRTRIEDSNCNWKLCGFTRIAVGRIWN